MSNTLADDVQALLSLPKVNQDQIFKQFANLEKPERIAVMEKHRTMVYKLKNLNLPQPIAEVSYVALAVSIIQYKEERKKIAKKNYDGLSLEEIGELNDFEAEIYQAKHERPSPQTEAVMKYWGTITRMKKKRVPVPTILHMLEDKYGVVVSRSTLYRAWNTMENMNELLEENE
jgi:hypothetical protein